MIATSRTRTVELYFDIISPYSYFAWLALPQRCAQAGVELVYKPVLLAALLSHGNTRGPGEIPAKRAFLIRDTLRYAGRHHIEFTWPRMHPFNPLTALRLCLPEVSGEQRDQVVAALWHAGWARGEDLGSPDSLVAILDRAGFDGAGLVAATQAPAAKDALRRATDEAIARGVFGVPTMAVGDELFWGNDRLDDVFEHLAGKDPLDRVRLAEIMARPMGLVRP